MWVDIITTRGLTTILLLRMFRKPEWGIPASTHSLQEWVMTTEEAARQLTNEHRQGYTVCDCGEFAYVFDSKVLRRLPCDYSGELCQRCRLWMCRVKALREARGKADD